jgi:hypothetical protein
VPAVVVVEALVVVFLVAAVSRYRSILVVPHDKSARKYLHSVFLCTVSYTDIRIPQAYVK